MDTYVAEQGYDPNNYTYLQPMPVSYSPEHYEYYPPMPFAYPRIHPWPPGYHQCLMPPHMMEMGFPPPWGVPPYMTVTTADDRKGQKQKKTKKPKNISADPLFQRFCQAKYGELVQLQPHLCRNDIIKILEGLWSQMPELDRQLYAPPNIPQIPVPGQAYQFVEYPSQYLIPVSVAGNANSWPVPVLTQPQPAPNPQPVGETAESFIADLPTISDDVLFQIIKEVGLEDNGTVTLAATDQKQQKQQEADASGKVIEVVHTATKSTSFEPHDGSIILPGTSLLTVNNPSATGSQKLQDHSFSKPPILDDGYASKSSLSSNDQRGSDSDCFPNETASDGKTSYTDPVMTITSASNNAPVEGFDISITFPPNSGAINTINYDAAGNANETMPVKTVSNACEVDSINYHQQSDMFDWNSINQPVQVAQDPSYHLSNTDMPFDPQQDNIYHVTMAEMASLCDASPETIRCASEILSAGENGTEREREVDVVSQVGNLLTIPEGCSESIDSNYFNMQQNHDDIGVFSGLLFDDQDILSNACQMSALLNEDMINPDESGSCKPDDVDLMISDWGKVSGSENLQN